MKSTFIYDHYYTHEQLLEWINYFTSNYSNYCSKEVIAVSAENREVIALTITNFASGKASDKPALYLDGNTHAGEVTGCMSALHFVDMVLTNCEEPSIKSMLTNKTIYCIPRIAVDGANAYLTTPDSYRSSPKLKEKVYGFHPSDVNRDGKLLLMRYKDSCGMFKKDDSTPFGLVLRKASDIEGEFYSLIPEGKFDANVNPFDFVMEKLAKDYDFNRNYPYGWNNEPIQDGAGEYPLCHPETKAQVDFILAHKNIGLVITNHTAVGANLYPPGTYPSKNAPGNDIEIYETIGNLASDTWGYPPINIFDTFLKGKDRADSGAFDDFCYETQGLLAYTPELWDGCIRFGNGFGFDDENKSVQHQLDKWNNVIKWAKENNPDAIYPWTPYIDETLGEVEIGGLDYKFVTQNPPCHMLHDECKKQGSWLIQLPALLPQIKIENVSISKVDESTYSIDAVIANTSYLSTDICAKAKQLKLSKGITVSLSGVQTITDASIHIDDLQGFSQSKVTTGYIGPYNNSLAKSKTKLQWIVKASVNQPFSISVSSVKAGCFSKSYVIE